MIPVRQVLFASSPTNKKLHKGKRTCYNIRAAVENHVDKYFILKLYKRPPRFQAKIMSSALNVIPILVITHLFFSIIYTEKTMFPVVTIKEFFESFGLGAQASISTAASSTSSVATGQAGFFERASQGHVLLLLVLLVLVVVAVFLTLVFQYVIPLSAIARFMRTCSAAVAFCKCCERGYKKNHKPPFSECYAVPFNASESIDSAKLTDLEVRIGYEKRYFGEAGKQNYRK